MADLESRLKLKNLSPQLMAVAVATDVVIEQIQDYASKEVESSALCTVITFIYSRFMLTTT